MHFNWRIKRRRDSREISTVGDSGGLSGAHGGPRAGRRPSTPLTPLHERRAGKWTPSRGDGGEVIALFGLGGLREQEVERAVDASLFVLDTLQRGLPGSNEVRPCRFTSPVVGAHSNGEGLGLPGGLPGSAGRNSGCPGGSGFDGETGVFVGKNVWRESPNPVRQRVLGKHPPTQEQTSCGDSPRVLLCRGTRGSLGGARIRIAAPGTRLQTVGPARAFGSGPGTQPARGRGKVDCSRSFWHA